MARIFVGTSANGEDSEAELTLEYSLRKNSSCAPEIIWMRQTRDTSSIWGGWSTKKWHTPFTGFRWAIPEACQFEGRAIYMDIDMINFRDIDDLFNLDMGNKPFMVREYNGRLETSVILFDCNKSQQYIPPLETLKSTENLSQKMQQIVNKYAGKFDPRWNCLDGETRRIDDIWILHYTKMASQPWHPSWYRGVTEAHARSDIALLWHQLHGEAITSGCKAPEYEPFGKYDIIGK